MPNKRKSTNVAQLLVRFPKYLNEACSVPKPARRDLGTTESRSHNTSAGRAVRLCWRRLLCDRPSYLGVSVTSRLGRGRRLDCGRRSAVGVLVAIVSRRGARGRRSAVVARRRAASGRRHYLRGYGRPLSSSGPRRKCPSFLHRWTLSFTLQMQFSRCTRPLTGACAVH